MPCKTRTLLAVLVLFGALWVSSATAHAGPPAPLVASLSQPDGVSFNARAWGDEWSNGMETLDGYTIVDDAASGYWVYAARSANGDLIPAAGPKGNLVVGRDSSSRLPKAVRPDRPAGTDRAPRAARAPQGYLRPNSGTHKVLVILAQFTNQFAVGTTADYWSNSFFGATGSVKAYYHEVSYGQLTIAPAAETSGTINDGVVGWLTLASAHPNGGNDQYVHDAIDAADAYVDFASLDTNGDGYLSFNELHIVVIAAGYEQSYGGSSSCSPNVWAHEWRFPNGGVSAPVVDGKTVAATAGNGGYTTLGEWHCVGIPPSGHAATIGTFTHELGHDLGWPDLYDVGGDTAGVGVWSIMGSGSWNRSATGYPGDSPAHPEAWSKWYQGWLVPTQITGSSPGQAIPQIETNATAYYMPGNPGGVDWWWYAHAGTGEYHLAENRQRVGFDVGLPNCGLLVWHIDESVTYTNNANADQTHRLVDLEQADGQNHLDILYASGGNHGDASDSYPGLTNNRTLNGTSIPNSNFYNGAPSYFSVANIGDCSSTMTADLSAIESLPAYSVHLPMIAGGAGSALTGINGQVTFNGAPAAGVALLLRFYNGSTWSTLATRSTAADGTYDFVGIPSLTSGQFYHVRYNNPDMAGAARASRTCGIGIRGRSPHTRRGRA